MYWPNYALDFAAVSPAVAVDSEVTVTRTNGGATINYDFSETECPHNVNYMYADYVPNTQEYSGSVALKFRHALAKLKVCVKQGETHTALGYPINVYVTSAKIVGIHDKGEFSVAYTNTGDNASVSKTSRVWDNTSGDDELSIISSTQLTSVGVNSADGYYVIPQTLNENHKFVITYTVTIGEETFTYEEKEVLLKDITLTQTVGSLPNGEQAYSPSAAWGTNKSILYTITINSTKDLTNEITFTATEETWGDVEGEQTYNPGN